MTYKYIPIIDYMKAFAILLVTTNHFFSYPDKDFPLFSYVIQMGMPVFMLLIGFNTAMSNDRHHRTTLKDFYAPKEMWRHFAAILPAYTLMFFAEATLLATEDIVPLPVVCIPTEPGSGTEVTPEIHAAQSGLGRLTLVRNPLVTPQLAFMDARYSEWMDIHVIQSHYMKTMGRAIEAIISETANPLSDAMAIGALGALANMRAIVLNASRVDEKGVKQGFSIHDREQLMLISNQVGLAVALSGGANILEALASPLTYVSKLHLGEAYGLVMPPLVDILTLRVPLLGDVVLQSLGFRRFEDLEDFLWELIDEIVPITTDDLERCANAAANNPLVKGGALTLEFKDIAACYEHLVADDEDLIVEEDDDDEEIFDEE